MDEAYRDPFQSVFQLSQMGLKVVIVLIVAFIVLGLIAAFTVFRHNLTGPKIMGTGIVLIALGVVFHSAILFNYLTPSLPFIVLLLGIFILFVGLCWKK